MIEVSCLDTARNHRICHGVMEITKERDDLIIELISARIKLEQRGKALQAIIDQAPGAAHRIARQGLAK